MKKMLLLQEFENHIKKMKKGEILTPRGDYYTEFAIKNYTDEKKTLSIFLQGKDIELKKINFHWYEKFRLFLLKKEYAKNSIALKLNILKAFLNKKNSENKSIYDGKGIKTSIETTTAIASTIDELKILLKCNLNESESRIRDIYIINCFIGLRLRDLRVFISEIKKIIRTINGQNFFEIRTSKTNEQLFIPAAKIVLQITTKRKFNLGQPISQQYYSHTLKKIIKKTGLDREILFHRTEGGKRITRTVLYSDLIGPHTARRTFATNAYLAGINPIDIMRITGHKSYTSFIKYIRCDNMAIAIKVAQHEFFNLTLSPVKNHKRKKGSTLRSTPFHARKTNKTQHHLINSRNLNKRLLMDRRCLTRSH